MLRGSGIGIATALTCSMILSPVTYSAIAADKTSPKETSKQVKEPTKEELKAAEEAAAEKARVAEERRKEQELQQNIMRATEKIQGEIAQIREQRVEAQTRYDKSIDRLALAKKRYEESQDEMDAARQILAQYAREAYMSGPSDLTFIAGIMDASSPTDALRRSENAERVGVHKDTEYDNAVATVAAIQKSYDTAKIAVTSSEAALKEIVSQESKLHDKLANVVLEWAAILGSDDSYIGAQAKRNADAASYWAEYLNDLAKMRVPSVSSEEIRSGRLPKGMKINPKYPGTAIWSSKGHRVTVISDTAINSVTYSISRLGAGYRWNTNTDYMMDCSALVDRAWNTPGLPKNEAEKDRDPVPGGVTGLAKRTPLVGKSKILPGDLVFLSDKGHGVNHVGLSLSPGMFIASDAETGAVNALSVPSDRVWNIGRESARKSKKKVSLPKASGETWQCGASKDNATTLPTIGSGSVPNVCPPSPNVFAEANMQPAAIVVGRCTAAAWPQLVTIGGWRPSDPYPDHPSGQALDIMMPDGCSTDPENLAIGNAIATFYMNNADKYGIVYMIWQQRIWNHTYEDPKPVDQWRSMSNRGSCTANHQDHVHVSTVGPVELG